jgi:putative cardiolipin synthase
MSDILKLALWSPGQLVRAISGTSSFLRLTILVLTLLMHTHAEATPLADIYDGLQSTADHKAYILETGDDALLARIHLIQNAQSTIDIQTFIWSNDDSGRFVFYELLRAAQRGVKIRLLVDDMSMRSVAEYVAYLATAHPNIQIKQYNPLSENIDAGLLATLGSYTLKFGQTNQRMHNKTVIVDEKYGITGGRNYADDYFDRGIDRSFKDRDILIVGAVVGSMVDSFQAYWDFELSVSSRDMKDVQISLEAGDYTPADVMNYSVPSTFKALLRCAEQFSCMQVRILEGGFDISDVSFVADVPGKFAQEGSGSGYANTTKSLIDLMQGAERAIVMQTPYLVVGKKGKKLMERVRENSPELEIIVSTNSLGAADHFYAYAFAYKNKKTYLKKFKWQLFEFKPTPVDLDVMVPPLKEHERAPDHYTCIHAKTFLFDGETAWVGSYNLDPRSASLNTEAGLIIRDAELVAELEATIRNMVAPHNSWTVGVRRKIPVLAQLSGMVENISSRLPFLNVWPFRYATSFELKSGGTEVPFYDKKFHDNYRSVGQFPGSNVSEKAMKTRLTKAFFGPAEPII